MWSKHIIYKILKDEKRTKRCNHWIPTVPTKLRIIKLIPKVIAVDRSVSYLSG